MFGMLNMFCMIQQTASANLLNIDGEERSPKGRRVSINICPSQHMPRRIHCAGFTGKSQNACLMSILLMGQLVPVLRTKFVASSNWVYFTEKFSLSMPSLIDCPFG